MRYEMLDLKWFASDYLNDNRAGVITEDNVIVIGVSVGLSMEQCQKIAQWHNSLCQNATREDAGRE